MPRLNANDDNGIVVKWFVAAGEPVRQGDLIAQIETTKAAVDIESDSEGYFFPLIEAGASAEVGAAIAWITSSYDPDALALERKAEHVLVTSGKRLASRKALALIEKYHLDFADIPGSGPISADDVEKYAAAGAMGAPIARVEALTIDPTSVVLFGAAEAGAVVADALLAAGAYSPLCFIDDKPAMHESAGLPVFSAEALPLLHDRGVRYAHVCIGAPGAKLKVAERLKKHSFEIVQTIHPRAIISPTATLGEGVYVGPGVVIGPSAVVGDYAQINNNATVPHHVRIGVGVRVSDGANIAGGVQIGDRTLLGLGVTINTGCHIGSDVTIMSGVSVFNAVPDGALVRVSLGRR